MLFSFTKAIFATLALGVAAVSAAPTPAPANAVAKRASDDVLAVLADVQADLNVDLGKLSMLKSYLPLCYLSFMVMSIEIAFL